MSENKFSSVLLCISIIFGSFILSLGMGKITHAERTVSVRGLAEQEVDADLAVWKLGFTQLKI